MVLLELSVTPLGEGESVSEAVAECVALIEASGLPHELHSMGTIVEGELPEVMSLMQRCIETMAAKHRRVSCAAKLDYREGATGRIAGKVQSVRSKLAAKS